MSRPVVPGFEVEAVLGSGASSVVWRARRLADDRDVALKITRSALRAPDPVVGGWDVGPESAEAVLAEIGWLRQLRHPGVVGLLDAFALADDRLVLVLELADGGSLAELVRSRGHLTPAEVVAVLARLAQTLHDLHRDQVVHGDLSPGNVLLDAHGDALVADLGTARALDDATDDVWGTDGFVAPEVRYGADPSPASDVWSLGALAWLALVGEPRETATDPLELAARAPDTPEALVDVVLACLAPDPAGRPDAGTVRDRLATMGGDERVDVAVGDCAADVTRRVREQAAAQRAARARIEERAAKMAQAQRAAGRPRLVGRRTLAVAAACGLALGIGGAAWWGSGRSAARTDVRTVAVTTSRPRPAPATAPRSTVGAVAQAEAVTLRPREVLQGLVDARADALMARDPRRLAGVDLPGGWAWQHDRATVAELARRRQEQHGLAFRVTGARTLVATPVEAVVRATVARDDFSWRESGGQARLVAGHSGSDADYVLRWTPSGWRLVTVRPPSTTG